jgi:hypothetical protein
MGHCERKVRQRPLLCWKQLCRTHLPVHRGIALALTSIGKTPGQKANSSDANARVLIAEFICCDANLQFTVARRSKIVVGRHCGASKSAATARPTQALRHPPHAASQAKTLCDAKNVIVYLAASDVFHGFERLECLRKLCISTLPLCNQCPPSFSCRVFLQLEGCSGFYCERTTPIMVARQVLHLEIAFSSASAALFELTSLPTLAARSRLISTRARPVRFALHLAVYHSMQLTLLFQKGRESLIVSIVLHSLRR